MGLLTKSDDLSDLFRKPQTTRTPRKSPQLITIFPGQKWTEIGGKVLHFQAHPYHPISVLLVKFLLLMVISPCSLVVWECHYQRHLGPLCHAHFGADGLTILTR